MDPLNIVTWLVIGALAGLIAAWLTKSESSAETVIDLIVGVIGGFVGGYILSVLNAMGSGAVAGINISGAVVAIVGAVILLAVVEFLRRPSQ